MIVYCPPSHRDTNRQYLLRAPETSSARIDAGNARGYVIPVPKAQTPSRAALDGTEHRANGEDRSRASISRVAGAARVVARCRSSAGPPNLTEHSTYEPYREETRCSSLVRPRRACPQTHRARPDRSVAIRVARREMQKPGEWNGMRTAQGGMLSARSNDGLSARARRSHPPCVTVPVASPRPRRRCCRRPCLPGDALRLTRVLHCVQKSVNEYPFRSHQYQAWPVQTAPELLCSTATEALVADT